MAEDKTGVAGAAAATASVGSGPGPAAPAANGVTTNDKGEKKGPNGRPLMAVKVYAPFKVYYEGDAYSITAVNETGPFDILPHHHNFLCMLIPCDLIIQAPDETRTVKIARALMHVKSENVVIYVDV